MVHCDVIQSTFAAKTDSNFCLTWQGDLASLFRRHVLGIALLHKESPRKSKDTTLSRCRIFVPHQAQSIEYGAIIFAQHYGAARGKRGSRL